MIPIDWNPVIAGGAPLQWRVFSCSFGPRALRTGARGPEEHDAPLEWRAPSNDVSANCGNYRRLHSGLSAAVTRVSTTRVFAVLRRVPPLERQPDREPARAD